MRQKAAAKKPITNWISKTKNILLVGLAVGAVSVGAGGQNAGAHGQQHDGVDRVGRELLFHQQERESGGEGELGDNDERGGGDGELGEAVGVEIIVEAANQDNMEKREIDEYLEILVYNHTNGTKSRRKETHHQLDLQNQRIGNRLLCLLVHQLYPRQNKPVQKRRQKRENKPQNILLVRLPVRPVTARPERQNPGAHGQQHDGVDRVGRELLLHQQKRESGGEAEVGGYDEGLGGDGELGHAVGVEVVVEAGEDADGGGGGEYFRGYEEGLCGWGLTAAAENICGG
nr:hypothetical protein Iba_chr13cCG7200 [Ipomoea batatas]